MIWGSSKITVGVRNEGGLAWTLLSNFISVIYLLAVGTGSLGQTWKSWELCLQTFQFCKLWIQTLAKEKEMGEIHLWFPNIYQQQNVHKEEAKEKQRRLKECFHDTHSDI